MGRPSAIEEKNEPCNHGEYQEEKTIENPEDFEDECDESFRQNMAEFWDNTFHREGVERGTTTATTHLAPAAKQQSNDLKTSPSLEDALRGEKNISTICTYAGIVRREPYIKSKTSDQSEKAMSISKVQRDSIKETESTVIYKQARKDFWQKEFMEDSLRGKDSKEFSQAFSVSERSDIPRPLYRNRPSTIDEEIGKTSLPERSLASAACHVSDQSTQSRPGAFAYIARGSSLAQENDTTNSTDDDVHPGDHVSRISITPTENDESAEQRRQSTVSIAKAKMIDDAEPVFYAKDVRHDRFRRNVIRAIIALGGLVAVAVTVVMMTVFSQEREGDPVCWPRVENQNAIVRCTCSNSTFGLYDELGEYSQELYAYMLKNIEELYEERGLEWESFDVDSCTPVNQVLLYGAQIQLFDLDPTALEMLTPESIDTALFLILLYVYMDGLHWEEAEKWLETPALCSWYRVGCMYIDIVTELKLAGNGLSGSMPDIVGLGSNLRFLDVSSNDITGTIPTELFSLSNIHTLLMSHMSLEGTIPSEIASLTELGMFTLQKNDLTGSIPSEIFGMSALRELDLADNFLSGPLPESDNAYTAERLSVLRLNHNQLTGTVPSSLGRLTHLELLNLASNAFTGTVPEFLGDLPRLRFLLIQKSGLTGGIPESFCDRLKEDEDRRMIILVECKSMIEECSCCSKDLSSDSLIRLQCKEDFPELDEGTEF